MMRVDRLRVRSLLWAALLLLSAGSVSAAGGSLEGKVQVLGGAPEPGWMVKVTPVVDEGAPVTVPVIGGGFEVPELVAGLYVAVVVRDKKEIGLPARVVVAPGVNTVDLLVDLRLLDQPRGARPWYRQPRVWGYAAAGVAGAWGLAELLEDDDEDEKKEKKASPSTP